MDVTLRPVTEDVVPVDSEVRFKGLSAVITGLQVDANGRVIYFLRQGGRNLEPMLRNQFRAQGDKPD